MGTTTMENEGNNYPVCPRCKGYIPNNEQAGQYMGALSRLDGETEICSRCGTDEALQQMYGEKLTDWRNNEG